VPIKTGARATGRILQYQKQKKEARNHEAKRRHTNREWQLHMKIDLYHTNVRNVLMMSAPLSVCTNGLAHPLCALTGNTTALLIKVPVYLLRTRWSSSDNTIPTQTLLLSRLVLTLISLHGSRFWCPTHRTSPLISHR
jgi:hypothetical protein